MSLHHHRRNQRRIRSQGRGQPAAPQATIVTKVKTSHAEWKRRQRKKHALHGVTQKGYYRVPDATSEEAKNILPGQWVFRLKNAAMVNARTRGTKHMAGRNSSLEGFVNVAGLYVRDTDQETDEPPTDQFDDIEFLGMAESGAQLDKANPDSLFVVRQAGVATGVNTGTRTIYAGSLVAFNPKPNLNLTEEGVSPDVYRPQTVPIRDDDLVPKLTMDDMKEIKSLFEGSDKTDQQKSIIRRLTFRSALNGSEQAQTPPTWEVFLKKVEVELKNRGDITNDTTEEDAKENVVMEITRQLANRKLINKARRLRQCVMGRALNTAPAGAPLDLKLGDEK